MYTTTHLDRAAFIIVVAKAEHFLSRRPLLLLRFALPHFPSSPPPLLLARNLSTMLLVDPALAPGASPPRRAGGFRRPLFSASPAFLRSPVREEPGVRGVRAEPGVRGVRAELPGVRGVRGVRGVTGVREEAEGEAEEEGVLLGVRRRRSALAAPGRTAFCFAA